MIPLVTHISKNEIAQTNKAMDEALYSEVSEEATETEGLTLPEETDINIGRRQCLFGLVSTVILLVLHNTHPVYEYIGNTVVMIFNGIIIFSMLGYAIEGFLDWHSPVKHSTEVEEGE
jgi:hypothetical protein